MSIFNDRLKGLRELKDWSKAATAKKLGISIQRYANWEYGARQPDYEMLASIAKIFNTTTDYLIGKTDTIEPPTKSQTESTDLDKMLDNARSYDGKPMTPHDRKLIKQYLEALYSDK